eukprot:765078-Pyramimonas_sp.AAC.2
MSVFSPKGAHFGDNWQGGAELDWKTRPGKYIESSAYLTLKVQAAAPITRPEPRPELGDDEAEAEAAEAEAAPARPYARVVFVSEYKDPELYVKLRKV